MCRKCEDGLSLSFFVVGIAMIVRLEIFRRKPLEIG